MNTAQSFITLAIGILVGVGLTAAVVATAQTNTSVSAAEELARRNAGVVIQSTSYAKEHVKYAHNREVIIFEDRKRNRLCYITKHTEWREAPAIDCDILDRRVPR